METPNWRTRQKNQRDCQRQWKRSVATNGRLAIIMASSLSNMILYVHFHIYLLPASPLKYDTLLHLQNLEECPQHRVGLKKYLLNEWMNKERNASQGRKGSQTMGVVNTGNCLKESRKKKTENRSLVLKIRSLVTLARVLLIKCWDKS